MMPHHGLDLSSLPLTLQEWRDSPAFPSRDVWNPLEPFFATHGLLLFEKMLGRTVQPQDKLPRMHEFGLYSIGVNVLTRRIQDRPTHCFARTFPDGRDVLIRLIAKGGHGLEELDILRAISAPQTAYLGENHCVVMQREIALDDMVFGIFPVLGEDFDDVADFNEVLNYTTQLLQGLNFLHTNLIAHMDIDHDNILINYIGDGFRVPEGNTFRKIFPIRYVFIDFELSVRFDAGTNPEHHLVTGLPICRTGSEHAEDYGRDIAPELLSDIPARHGFTGKPYDFEVSNMPYNPFKLDIWQLGNLFMTKFIGYKSSFPALVQIFEDMVQDTPHLRPTAKDALQRIRVFADTISVSELKTKETPNSIDHIYVDPRVDNEARSVRRKARDGC